MVKAGQTVEVTERGRLVALLVPATPAATARDILIAQGQLLAASAPFQPPPRRVAANEETSTVLADLREDR